MAADSPPLTVPAALSRVSDTSAEGDAVVTLTARLTWAQVDTASRALATVLVDRGIDRGTRVGLMMPNGIEWAVAAFAVMRLGAVLVPLSTLLRVPELEEQLQVAQVEHLLLVDDFRGRDYVTEFAELEPKLRSVWTWSKLSRASSTPDSGEVAARLESEVTPADDLVVLFTSGSSGAPKGVIHTHGNALRAVASGLDVRCVRRGERLYLPMPLFWAGGFSGGLMTVLVAGATLLTEAIPTPDSTMELLSRERATLFRGWPDQARQLAAHPAASEADLTSLREGSLDALLPQESRAAPGARANLFGMTETFGPYCGDALDRDMPRGAWGSCGTPFDGVEVLIADPETGEARPVEVYGEIWVRGPNLMRGICGRSDDEVFTGQGWYRTGDLGHQDADGRLWYHGRLDDMVKISGATIYPSEVEEALLTVPGVQAAFVIDIPDGDGRPRIAAAVVPMTGVSLSTADVFSGLRARLSAFKVPGELHILEPGTEVTRTATGKTDKAALRRLLLPSAVSGS